MIRKLSVILLCILAHIIPLGAADPIETNLLLDFETASYYEFGFSAAPVHAGSDPTPITTDQSFLTTDGEIQSGSINSKARTIYAYWNIVSPYKVTLKLEMGGKLLPESPPEGYKGIDWTVTREDTSGFSLSTAGITAGELTTIEPTLGSNASASSRVGSIPLVIQASYNGEVVNMIAGKYSSSLTLEVIVDDMQ